MTITGSASLDLNGLGQQATSLSGAGSVINSNTTGESVVTLSASGGSTTFGGAIQGGGTLGTIGLVMSGSGTQVLSGSNTFTGGSAVQSGRLVVNGSLVSRVTVQSGGTLSGTGDLGSVTVTPSGQLAPGNPLGPMNLSGSLNLELGAVMDYELDTPTTSSEVLMPSGDLILSGQRFSAFNFTWTTNFAPGTYDLIAFGTLDDAMAINASGLAAPHARGDNWGGGRVKTQRIALTEQ